MFQLRTKSLDAAQREKFMHKLESWGQEFGGDWVQGGNDFNVFYFKGEASSDSINKLSNWPEVSAVVEENAPPFTVTEMANKKVKVHQAEFGDSMAAIIAGPCAVENFDSMLEIANELSAIGIQALRAGAFKPRTSPYAFQGLGEQGLEILAAVAKQTGMAVVTEVLDP
ncbi:MAG: hypothetical protein QGF46_04390, partial [Planctomycetota bacterium]|nr:hypothetical protein [Planctomycetota bacterium]